MYGSQVLVWVSHSEVNNYYRDTCAIALTQQLKQQGLEDFTKRIYKLLFQLPFAK